MYKLSQLTPDGSIVLNGEKIADTILYVNGEYVKKSEAVISVYDSGFQHGDGVYEGIRAYDRRVYRLEEHIKRLYESCYTLGINIGMTQDEMKQVVKELVKKNIEAGIHDIHMRLQVTRGFKAQTGMHPTLNITNSSIVICVDEKPPIFNKDGITLITTWLKRYNPQYMDPKIHCCNQLNQIMAACEAMRQGADEAIMLDQNGYVAETNSTNLQLIKDGALVLPTLDSQLPGITRKTMIQIAKDLGMEVQERNVSISEYYNADEVFICGTVGEVVPIKMIDGKKIGHKVPGSITEKFSQEYKKMTETFGVSIDD
ncbi:MULTISPECIES: aminotransferase class IV [unclassified Sedimentibacter]|uniref:aminotransferase class IV n=1 Tax=unclassified Sedimentibacter TaxID=2649220 RepID=UPI0027DFBA7F|nr:aminotransferase class IV [Sedimentibacter sp. MB35-C1]WMJ78120.1 aminotransferase class IV [Sedimentibacter sp. MB35-C1]